MPKQNHPIEVIDILNEAYATYSAATFVEDDPIQIPHRYASRSDIEIAGFLTATIAWGNRKSIINSASKLMALMDDSPHDFIVNHEEIDRKRFESFVHRTFQGTDILYFVDYLQRLYRSGSNLETALSKGQTMKEHLTHFHNDFFAIDYAPQRTRKHVSTPAKGSACKRLNMYLRWMVRAGAVDFGLWHKISTAELMIPLDVHVERVARSLGLLTRPTRDWRAVEELTRALRQINTEDPVKYDFALFGLGVAGHR